MAWTKRSGIMLCQPLDDKLLVKNFAQSPQLLVQPKLDGQRCWINWAAGYPVLISSQGNPIMGAPHVELALREWARICGKMPLDGELYAHHLSFEQIVSRTRRLASNLHSDYTAVHFHVFDFKDFEHTQDWRTEKLLSAFSEWRKRSDPLLTDIIQLVPTRPVDSEREITKYLDHFIDLAYEGIIVRNPLAHYQEKRLPTILKWKPSKSDWYRVKDIEEAISETGLPLGRAGAVVCEDRFGNIFRTGSGLGLSLYDLESIWQNRLSLRGQFVQVKYQNLTTGGIPRFGKYTTFSPTNGEEESW